MVRSAVSQLGAAYYGPQGNRCAATDQQNADRYQREKVLTQMKIRIGYTPSDNMLRLEIPDLIRFPFEKVWAIVIDKSALRLSPNQMNGGKLRTFYTQDIRPGRRSISFGPVSDIGSHFRMCDTFYETEVSGDLLIRIPDESQRLPNHPRIVSKKDDSVPSGSTETNNTQRVVDTVRQFGTSDRPVTCEEVANFMEVDITIVQSRLATQLRKQRHLFRKGVHLTPGSRKSFVYWWDETKLNPDFGLAVLERTRGGIPVDRRTGHVASLLPVSLPPSLRELSKPRTLERAWKDTPPPPPKPQPIQIRPKSKDDLGLSLTFNAGTVPVTKEELKNLYDHLKFFFG